MSTQSGLKRAAAPAKQGFRKFDATLKSKRWIRLFGGRPLFQWASNGLSEMLPAPAQRKTRYDRMVLAYKEALAEVEILRSAAAEYAAPQLAFLWTGNGDVLLPTFLRVSRTRCLYANVRSAVEGSAVRLLKTP